jgi:hypothetical protein
MMAERRHQQRIDDNEIIAMQSIVAAFQMVPHERRDPVMAYVRERLAGLSYIDPSGQEVPPPKAAVPVVPLPERPRDGVPPLIEAEREDKSGG